MSCSEWKIFKLDDIAVLRKEQVQPNGVEQPYIGLEHIGQQTLSLVGVGSSNDVISNKLKFYSGDILYGKLRPYFRKVYHPKFEGVCSTDIFVIKNKDGFDKTFLYYLVATEEFTSIANSGSSGTRMPRADWSQLVNSEWLIPSLPTQTRIASILSSLDDAIELNLQINKTLEETAKTIFKEWFVDFNFPNATGEMQSSELGNIPVGWKIGSIEDLLFLSKESVNPSKQPDIDFFHYSIPAYDEGKNPSIEKGSAILSNKFQVKKNSILVSKLNPRFPRTWAIGEVEEDKSICSTEFQVLIPLEPFYFSYGLWLFAQDFVIDIMKSRATGTSGSHQRIKPQDILNINIALPNDDLLKLFHKTVSEFSKQIDYNKKENQILSALRNTLLPQLMKGEIEING